MAPLRRTVSAVAMLLGFLLLLASPAEAAAAAAAAEGGEIRMKHSDCGYPYNRTLAHILVQYASAVYTSDLTSLLTWTCPSASNWIEDLFWKQLDVTYPGMPSAMVHHGFYSAYYNTTLRREILKSVQLAWKTYGRIPINVVGHSMGGALASFCALDLSVKYGSQGVELMTFGQPRVGNPAFAEYFSAQVPRTIRVTHQNDIVPHLPPYFYYLGQWTYHHFAREVWLHETIVGNIVTRNETVCDCSGEDPSCSRSVYGRSVADHLEYYGVSLHADSRGTCQFVIGVSNSAYSNILEVDGTIILSRYPQELHASI